MGLSKRTLKGMSVDDFADIFFGGEEVKPTVNNELEYRNIEIPKDESKKRKVNLFKEKVYELFDKGLLNNEIIALGSVDGFEFKKSNLDNYRVKWLKENEGTEKYKKYKEAVKTRGKTSKSVKKETSKTVDDSGDIILKNCSVSYKVTKKGVKLKSGKDIELDSEDLDVLINKLKQFSRRLKG